MCLTQTEHTHTCLIKAGRKGMLRRNWKCCCFNLVLCLEIIIGWNPKGWRNLVHSLFFCIAQFNHRNLSRREIHEICGMFLLPEMSLRPSLTEKCVFQSTTVVCLSADSLLCCTWITFLFFEGCLRGVNFIYIATNCVTLQHYTSATAKFIM